ncbi:MAG: hypothetical protein RJB61_2069, partial [Actinomycetota bacterium]
RSTDGVGGEHPAASAYGDDALGTEGAAQADEDAVASPQVDAVEAGQSYEVAAAHDPMGLRDECFQHGSLAAVDGGSWRSSGCHSPDSTKGVCRPRSGRVNGL